MSKINKGDTVKAKNPATGLWRIGRVLAITKGWKGKTKYVVATPVKGVYDEEDVKPT